MTEDARDAEKRRRRAEALRANLKKRKAARGVRAVPAETDGEDAAASETRTDEADKRGN